MQKSCEPGQAQHTHAHAHAYNILWSVTLALAALLGISVYASTNTLSGTILHAQQHQVSYYSSWRHLLAAAGHQEYVSGKDVDIHDPNWKWDWKNLVALALVTVNSIASAATGQGGTPILIPIFTALLGMETNEAVAVAAFVIFLGSIPSLQHALTMQHPYRDDTTLVDYTFLSLITPPMLLGIKAGVMLNRMSPAWFISFLLIAAYSWSTWKQLLGLIKYRRQETQMKKLMNRVASDVAALEAAEQAPGSHGNAAVDKAMLSLQSDIQEIGNLAHQLTKLESRTLPPQTLPLTTSSTVRSALDMLWLTPSNQHHFVLTPGLSSLASDDWDLGTPMGGSPRGTSPVRGGAQRGVSPVRGIVVHGGSPRGRHSSSYSRRIVAVHGSVPVRSSGVNGTQTRSFSRNSQSQALPAAPSVAAPTAAATAADPTAGWDDDHPTFSRATPVSRTLSRDDSLPLRVRVRHRRLHRTGTASRSVSTELAQTAGRGSTTGAAAGTAAAASTPAGTALSRYSSGHTTYQTAISRTSTIDDSTFHVSVVADGEQLIHLAHVLANAPQLTGALNKMQRSNAKRHHVLHRLVSRDIGLTLQQQTSLLRSVGSGGHPWPGSVRTSSLSGTSSSTAAAPESVRTPSLGPFVDPGLSVRHDSVWGFPAGRQTSLLSIASDRLGEQAAGMGDVEQGQAAAAAAAVSPVLEDEADGSNLQRLRQQLSPVGIAAGLKSWWQQQPKLQLLLVLATFLMYLALTGASSAVKQKCGREWIIMHAVFVGCVVILTVAASWAEWHSISRDSKAAAEVQDEDQQQTMPPAAGKKASTRVSDLDVSVDPEQSKFSGSPFTGAVKGSAAVDTNQIQSNLARAESFMTASSGLSDTSSDDITPTAAVATKQHSDTLNPAGGGAAAAAAAAQQVKEVNAVVIDNPYDEIDWTRTRLLYFPPAMFLVGVFSGLLGSSPNTLFLSPMLLAFGCHPQVSAATLKIALFVSSACSSLSYGLQGSLVLSQGLAFGISNLLTTPIGQAMMDYLIAKTGRSSHIMMASVLKNMAAIPLLIIFNGLPGIMDLKNGDPDEISFMPTKIC